MPGDKVKPLLVYGKYIDMGFTTLTIGDWCSKQFMSTTWYLFNSGSLGIPVMLNRKSLKIYSGQ
jgi:hypothetical protein